MYVSALNYLDHEPGDDYLSVRYRSVNCCVAQLVKGSTPHANKAAFFFSFFF